MAKSRSSAKKKLSKSQLERIKRLNSEELIGLCVRCWETFRVLVWSYRLSPDQIKEFDVSSELKEFWVGYYPIISDTADLDRIAEDLTAAHSSTDIWLASCRENTAANLLSVFHTLIDAAAAQLASDTWNWLERAEMFLSYYPTSLKGLFHNGLHYEATV